LYLLFFYYNLKQENGIKQTLADRKIEKERGRERGGGREREREGEREREREREEERKFCGIHLSLQNRLSIALLARTLQRHDRGSLVSLKVIEFKRRENIGVYLNDSV